MDKRRAHTDKRTDRWLAERGTMTITEVFTTAQIDAQGNASRKLFLHNTPKMCVIV